MHYIPVTDRTNPRKAAKAIPIDEVAAVLEEVGNSLHLAHARSAPFLLRKFKLPKRPTENIHIVPWLLRRYGNYQWMCSFFRVLVFRYSAEFMRPHPYARLWPYVLGVPHTLYGTKTLPDVRGMEAWAREPKAKKQSNRLNFS